jgi:predicted kinase
MAAIILAFGWPGNGKTTLATTLQAEHGFHRVDVDAVYVEFIQTHYPHVCPPDIGQIILQHYEQGFGREAARRSHWHSHLLAVIAAAAGQYPKVVADGYLLGHCRTTFQPVLAAAGHQVTHIRAEWHTYTQVGPGLTIADVNTLAETSQMEL